MIVAFIPVNVSNAAKKNAFVTKKGYRYYYDEKGKKVKNKMTEIGGSTYFFDKKGIMIKGWVKKNKKYYYFDRKTGKMKKNVKVDGVQLKKDGTAMTVEMSSLSSLIFRSGSVVTSLVRLDNMREESC